MSSDEEGLAARLDEDEQVALAWGRGSWEVRGHYDVWLPGTQFQPLIETREASVAAHIARHDPARALRFVEAVRAIIKESNGEGHGWAEHEPAYYAGLGYAVTLLAEVYDED